MVTEKYNIDAIGRTETDGCPGILVVNRYIGSLPPNLRDQLIQYSIDDSDTALQLYTRDKVRFGTLTDYEKWTKKERVVYTLTDSNNTTLYGLLWLGEDQLKRTDLFEGFNPKDYNFTYAKRLYKGARKKGLAGLQLRTAYRDFIDEFKRGNMDVKGIWAENKYENDDVLRVDLGFGFKRASDPDKERRIVTVASIFDIENNLKKAMFNEQTAFMKKLADGKPE